MAGTLEERLRDVLHKLAPGTVIDLAVEPGVNEYNGWRNVELQVKDVAFTSPSPR